MEPDWTSLDDLIMEKIFTMLSIRDRFNASLVCQRWSLCLDLPEVWRKVDIDGYWLTKPIRNDENKIYFSRVLDYRQITNCLNRIGSHFRWINIQQTEYFANLYQLFVVFESYFNKMLKNEQHHSSNIRKLTFKFPCDQPFDSDPNGIKLFGIGGQLISSFKKLLLKMPNLCELELVDLVIERYEANSLMDQISISFCKSLKVLSIINLTVKHCPLQQILMLSNLEILKISPQNINDSVLALIAVSKLKHLHIVQNENTPKTVMPCTTKAWTNFKHVASENIHVHLTQQRNVGANKMNNESECDLVIQPEAPIHSITCFNMRDDTARSSDTVNKIIENYGKCLSVYNDNGTTIGDHDLIDILSGCRKLSTLKIRRPITTAALLVISAIGENVQQLLIKKSFVIIRFDEWITEFCFNNGINVQWIQENCKTINAVECALSKKLSHQWRFLP